MENGKLTLRLRSGRESENDVFCSDALEKIDLKLHIDS